MKKITRALLFAVIASFTGLATGQVVDLTTDSNPTVDGELRFEIQNAAAGATITFDPSIAGQTITLVQGEIDISPIAPPPSVLASPMATLPSKLPPLIFKVVSVPVHKIAPPRIAAPSTISRLFRVTVACTVEYLI